MRYNFFLILRITFICLISKTFAHDEFLKYNASTGVIGEFETTDPYHADLLHWWPNYNDIKVHSDFINRAPSFNNDWTDAEKRELLYGVINHWDEFDWDRVKFVESLTTNNSVMVLFSTDPTPFQSTSGTVLAYVDHAVQNNRIVAQRTDQVPAGHNDHTAVVFNNVAGNGIEWVMWDVLDYSYEYSFLETALHEFGHVLGLAHCDVDFTVMAAFHDETRPRPTEEDPYFDDFAGLDIVNSGIIDGIEDYIWIDKTIDVFNINQPYLVNSIQAKFENIPPLQTIPSITDYITDWDDWQVYASYGCDEVLVMESGTFIIPNLPGGYNWERDGSSNVKARAVRGGIDNTNHYHQGEAEIWISGVPNNFITSGALTSDTYWCGNIEITGTITVPAGKTLTIASTAFIKFQNSAQLKVYGNLIVEWSPSIRPQLDFINISSSNGIYCYQGSNVDINHAEIINAYYGVRIDKSLPTIQNSDIYNCKYGIFFSNLNSVSAEPQILNNRIHDNSSYGLYFYSSGGDIRGNEIYNNYYGGIMTYYHSSPKFGDAYHSGDNNIHNTNYGFKAYYTSSPDFGRSGCSYLGGNNIIENNTYKNGYAYNSEVFAQNNWWGSNIESEITNKLYENSGSTIHYDPWLPSAPSGASVQNSNSPEEIAFNERFNTNSKNMVEQTTDKNKKYDYDPSWPIFWKMLYVRNLIGVEDYKFAREICKEVIDENPDSTLSFLALDYLWQATQEDDKEDFTDYLNKKVSSKYKKDLYGDMELILTNYETVKSARLSSLDVTANKYADTFIGELSLFHKFMNYFSDEEDEKMARSVSGELDKQYPKSESALEAHRLLGDKVEEPGRIGKSIGEENDLEEISNLVPEEYTLLGNYPNPFNPTTTIKYALPYSSVVELIIYDINGRIIKQFNNVQAAGYHNIVWDGTNKNGVKVTSGVYVYKIKAVAQENNGEIFEKSSKLMLVK